MQVVTVANLKGGVGKTATSHALAVVLSEDRRVLMIDADPQASLTRACGIEDARGRSLAEVLSGFSARRVAIRDVVYPLSDGLAIVPGHPALASVETSLRGEAGRESVLKRALEAASRDRSWARPFAEYVSEFYDVAIIDTPPNFGLLTVNALVAADGVLIPTIPEIVSFESLRLFFDQLARVRHSLNPRLGIIGVLPTFYDSRFLHHKAILEVMRAQGYPLLDVAVGRSVRVAEAASEGKSVVSVSPDNKRSLEYWVLGAVVNGWLEDHAA
jgi:chromosome partitioning protein